jgi:hypothetical protein
MLLTSTAMAAPAECVKVIEKFAAEGAKKGLKPSNYQQLDEVTIIYEMSSRDGYSEGFILTLHNITKESLEASGEKVKVLEVGQCIYEQQGFNYAILATDTALQAAD